MTTRFQSDSAMTCDSRAEYTVTDGWRAIGTIIRLGKTYTAISAIEGQIGVFASTREAMRAAALRRYSDPVERERQSLLMKGAWAHDDGGRRDGQLLLGLFLADDIVVEEALDLLRLGQVAGGCSGVCGIAAVVLKDRVADCDTLVTDIGPGIVRRRRDQLRDRVLGLVAK